MFYGCRDHTVRSMNLKSMESLPNLEPMHYDCVTSVIRTGGHLVSGYIIIFILDPEIRI